MKRKSFGLAVTAALALVLGVWVPCPAAAHPSGHPSIHDTVAGILVRLRRELTAEQLLELTAPKVEALLSPREREILASEHVRFRVNVPVGGDAPLRWQPGQ